MYYAIILLSVTMFGGCFAPNDIYRKLRGNSLKISMQFSLMGSLAGLVVLLVINRFRLEFTVFTLIMALLSALNGFAFTFCSFKALGSINLSLYSLFSMLGGMALPFIQGIAFYGEKITLAKSVCFLLICIALLLTVEKDKKRNGALYYIGIFIFNGMSGVLSKFFASAPLRKTSAAGFTMLISICTVVISSVSLSFFFNNSKDKTKPSLLSITISSLNGITNKTANFVLVIALAHVDASLFSIHWSRAAL